MIDVVLQTLAQMKAWDDGNLVSHMNEFSSLANKFEQSEKHKLKGKRLPLRAVLDLLHYERTKKPQKVLDECTYVYHQSLKARNIADGQLSSGNAIEVYEKVMMIALASQVSEGNQLSLILPEKLLQRYFLEDKSMFKGIHDFQRMCNGMKDDALELASIVVVDAMPQSVRDVWRTPTGGAMASVADSNCHLSDKHVE